MNETKFEPCPFCGNEEIYVGFEDDENGFGRKCCYCYSCSARGPFSSSDCDDNDNEDEEDEDGNMIFCTWSLEAIDKWNTRIKK